MNENRVQKPMGIAAFVAGILAVLFYLLHDLVGGAYYPGYDRMKQAVSDLTATDAPSFVYAIGYSAVYGIAACLCCAFLCFLVAGEKKPLRIGVYLFAAMQGVSAIGYSVFPLTGSGYDRSAQSFMHVYVVTVAVVLLSIASLVLIAIGAFQGGRKTLGILSCVALGCMFLGTVGSGALPKSVFGLFERFSTYSAVVFTGVLGTYGAFVPGKEKEG